MSEKIKNMAIRTASGVILTAVIFGAILYSKWSFGIMLLVILLGGMREFYRMTKRSRVAPQYILGTVMGVVFFVANFFAATDVISTAMPTQGLALYFILLIPSMFICEMFRKKPNPIADIGTTALGILYVAMPLALICYFPTNNGDWNPLILLFYILIIWSNDVFAYLVGMTIGKHKLFERLSPKKSWEGFFGGVIGAVAMGFLAAHVLGGNYFQWAGLALVASTTGVLGDLVESMFKRSTDMKDSGRSIPGHGGWLDRFDAMLLSAPFVFVYMVLTHMI